MTRRTTGLNVKRETQAYRIHGALKAAEHDLSIAELSRRLDIHKDTVRDIVRERGWKVRNGRADSLVIFNAQQAEPQELVFE